MFESLAKRKVTIGAQQLRQPTRSTIGRRLFFWGGIMSNALYRAECCGDLAECRRVAALCTSSEMRSHYLLLSEHYSTLAEAEELAALAGKPLRQL
jgi:hypothetical protein